MNQFLPEGLYPQPEGYTREDLLLAMQQRKILQAAAIKCDERHNLHVALGCCKGIIPRAEAARGILGGETRDIAILSRVGGPYALRLWALRRMERRSCLGAARRKRRWSRFSVKTGPAISCPP